jgi:3-phenylpropionate/trans-cinnamate dioxygenase ferredoxin reductase component
MAAGSGGVAIVGASLAGLNAAMTLRREGYEGPLTIVGEEPHRPYDRPPLSKEVLTGAWEPDRTFLPCDDDAIGARWLLGRRAVGLDVEARRLRLDDDSEESFPDGIVVATGAGPRLLPGPELAGVHVIRSLEDSVALAAALAAAPARVVVVGAGFIGGEVASACVSLGIPVSVVEAMPVPLAPVIGEELGAIVTEIHRRRGVDVRTGVGVRRLEGDAEGRVSKVHLDDGGAIVAEVVVVGIGVEPRTGWLADSGLDLGGGLVCDETGLAAPGIVGAGDVVARPSRRYGGVRRVEHWDNAVRQGQHAARRLLAGPEAAVEFDPVPWFWSDQHGLKLQLIGSARGAEEVRIVKGGLDDEFLLALYRRGDRLSAAFGIECGREVIASRRLIAKDATWEEATATYV